MQSITIVNNNIGESSNLIPYSINEDKEIIEDNASAAVMMRMRHLCQIEFKDILIDWCKQAKEKKSRVLETLHQEFPTPPEAEFDNKWMLSRMGRLIKNRKYEIRQAVRGGLSWPPDVSSKDWKIAKEELKKDPERFSQQREASHKQRESVGMSHLGSGGRGRFSVYFVSIIIIIF